MGRGDALDVRNKVDFEGLVESYVEVFGEGLHVPFYTIQNIARDNRRSIVGGFVYCWPQVEVCRTGSISAE